MNPRDFINTIVLDILEVGIAPNNLHRMGGSKNTLWQCAKRNTCLGNKPVLVLVNLINSEIKYSIIKKEKILKYLKQFLNNSELNYMKNDDINTLVRFVAKKINNNRKSDKMFSNFSDKTKNNMYDVMNEKEKKRLEFQKNLTKNEDLKVLEPILKRKENINILDVGCNNGDLIVDRIESLDTIINKLIGIDSNKEIVSEANDLNGSDVYQFYYSDIEKDSFSNDIEKIMNDSNIKGFDLVCISMLLLHLNKPYSAIKKLRKIMNDGATIFIRDIDDTIAMVYPDERKLFEKAKKISSEIETTGDRSFGRQIPTLLKKLGFKNILLHLESVNSLDMNYDDREILFNTVFSFILIDLPLLIKKYPSEKKYVEYYEWMKNVYEDMEKEFQSQDFFYQMGNIVFTAKK